MKKLKWNCTRSLCSVCLGTTRAHHHVFVADGLVDWVCSPCRCDITTEQTLYTHTDNCSCRTCMPARIRRIHEVSNAAKDAVALFRRHLNGWQKYTFTTRGYVDVTAADGSLWRLNITRRTSNVYRWFPARGKQGEWYRYCVVTSDAYIPLGDMYLAQLLMLQTNPKEFEYIAIVDGCAVVAHGDLNMGYWSILRQPFRDKK